ncbi:SDR family NAD(P)-dependent oxidoreductase [Saccharomonospora saliphila]|uniref:SDR family NAD(P)-dependent oxidoreductase n=1 Tax=Saccharomonospora saliphila TaxID=369829 RepID=UPI00039C5051|nr:SDR family oxidoreductase [Saccharomonospora saliphila]
MTTQRVALVTGSSTGIGAAVATRLAANGVRVVVNSVRSVEQGRALAESLPGALYVPGDVSVEQDVTTLVDTVIAEFGRLDILVNNAGTTKVIPHSDLDSVTAQVWRDILDVNVVGTWLVTRAALPHLRASGDGAVVNISSIAGSRPAGSSIPYAVSKAAINHMTRLLAGVVGPEVRVNAVAPGLVDTEWTKDFTEARAWMEANAPLRRTGTTDDVAEAVAHVADARYTTGEVLLVDGGTHLR